MSNELQFQLKELAIAILQSDSLSVEEIKSKALQLYDEALIISHAQQVNKIVPTTEKKIEKTAIDTTVTTDTAPSKTENDAIQTPTVKESVVEIPLINKAETDKLEIENIEIKNTEKAEEDTTEVPTLLQELEDLTTDFNLPDFEPLQEQENLVDNLAENETENTNEDVAERLENNIEKNTAHKTEITEIELENSIISDSKKEEIIAASTLSTVEKPRSLNDKLHTGFKIGLNDRLAFTQHLFGGNQEDFTRVISQLNTTPTLEEAISFIYGAIKPEYNFWEGKESYEIRFIELIERNFQS